MFFWNQALTCIFPFVSIIRASSHGVFLRSVRAVSIGQAKSAVEYMSARTQSEWVVNTASISCWDTQVFGLRMWWVSQKALLFPELAAKLLCSRSISPIIFPSRRGSSRNIFSCSATLISPQKLSVKSWYQDFCNIWEQISSIYHFPKLPKSSITWLWRMTSVSVSSICSLPIFSGSLLSSIP